MAFEAFSPSAINLGMHYKMQARATHPSFAVFTFFASTVLIGGRPTS